MPKENTHYENGEVRGMIAMAYRPVPARGRCLLAALCRPVPDAILKTKIPEHAFHGQITRLLRFDKLK